MAKQIPNFPPPKWDPLAALLSYLLPGLGQVVQGRIAKGMLFFVCLFGMFFYGQANGQWKNVWIPQPDDCQPTELLFGYKPEGLARSLNARREFLGQVWIGVAAWPAIVQYVAFDKAKDSGPVFGTYQRCPPEDEINRLQRDADKRWDLGWVFTVIAGMLNLLVIYDALAGPMFRNDDSPAAEAPK